MKTPTPYAAALALAQDLLTRLAPACVRIEIAGSIRRQEPTCGDIELVAIPRVSFATDLFGEPVGEPRSELDALLAQEIGPLDSWLFTKNGPAQKQFVYRAMSVDLFIVHPETWGCLFMIRTGGPEFSHWMVSKRSIGGALSLGLSIRDGRLWNGSRALDTPEEEDVFRLINIPYIPPSERSARGWFRSGLQMAQAAARRNA